MNSIEQGERQRLKHFLQLNIPFDSLKKIGFFGKDISSTDYEKIAERVRVFFGLKSIYDYQSVCDCPTCRISFGKSMRKCGSETGIKFKEYKPNIPEMLTKKEWLN